MSMKTLMFRVSPNSTWENTSLFRTRWSEQLASCSSVPSPFSLVFDVGDNVFVLKGSVGSQLDDEVDTEAATKAFAGNSGGRTAITMGGFSVLGGRINGGS